MDIQLFSNQFESTPVLSSHRLSCIHSYSTLIHSFFSYHFIPLLVISLYLSSITLPSLLVLTIIAWSALRIRAMNQDQAKRRRSRKIKLKEEEAEIEKHEQRS